MRNPVYRRQWMIVLTSPQARPRTSARPPERPNQLIAVVRNRLGALEDRFFATVFLGSGLLYIAMTFTSAALAGDLSGSY